MEFLKFTMEKCNHRTDISPVAVFYSVCTPECQRKTKAMSVLHRRWKEGRKISESDMRTVKIYQHVKNKNWKKKTEGSLSHVIENGPFNRFHVFQTFSFCCCLLLLLLHAVPPSLLRSHLATSHISFTLPVLVPIGFMPILCQALHISSLIVTFFLLHRSPFRP